MITINAGKALKKLTPELEHLGLSPDKYIQARAEGDKLAEQELNMRAPRC
jgi:hypothetical protein